MANRVLVGWTSLFADASLPGETPETGSHHILIGLTCIVVLGILAQWTAWRLRIPSILLLLVAGIAIGPVTGFLDPNGLFGDLLLPIVSLSVAVILYEGGLTLKFRDLRSIGGVFVRLTVIGGLVTWIVVGAAAYFFLGFDLPLAALLGAILVVTGPTVIGPMLRHLRLGGQVASLLRWEGIVIDPVGATLAVMVFTVVRAGTVNEGTAHALADLGRTLLVGGVLGVAGAALMTLALSRFWIPDSLQNPVSLALVLATHTAANVLQEEAGLLAVTLMGIVLANQKFVPIRHLVEFKENLTVLLISCLFVVLAARLEPQDLRNVPLGSFLFLAAIVFVARPASVFLATLGSKLDWRERTFLACMAPRGIVAAAVASVFALEMAAIGHRQAEQLVPVVFLVVFGTVLLYGLGSAPLARALGLASADPQGTLFVGAHAWARAMALSLQKEGRVVALVDTDWDNISRARMAGLRCHYGSILSEPIIEEIDFGSLGRVLALTSNDEMNSLTCLRYVEFFGRRGVYQLPFTASHGTRYESVPAEHRGRLLFGPGMNYSHLTELFGPDPEIRRTQLTQEFDYQAFRDRQGDAAVPLFLLKSNGAVVVFTAEAPSAPEPGQILLSIVVAGARQTEKEETQGSGTRSQGSEVGEQGGASEVRGV